jgi:carbamoyl-phosphate synthase large subunit
MPARKDIKKILVIGSGPIVIGQACEFDYSGTQAVTALKEEGYNVVLVNPNPATVMTSPGIADAIYVEPLKAAYVEAIIKKERPDAILSTMGGQTALNLTLDLENKGILKKYNVEIIGAGIESIKKAEDRGEFKKVVEKVGLDSPYSIVATTVKEALDFEKEIGLPLVVRPSYTLGGMGGNIAYTVEELERIIKRALKESPVGSALVEESLIGWKEFEMEVMRDKNDNAIIVCSIENIDPMGVHTGDSITIAPAQTLSDKEYQRMRTGSINILREVGVDCGGSNVQFACKPDSDRMIVIEMNPRVSRSSALASKATGFPIAKCSAKLAVGYTLDEVMNEITGITASCFEPALDYCAVKVPRFEMEKFPAAYSALGTQMKSVGESLALGRTALEALNKAIRAAEFGFDGLEEMHNLSDPEIETILRSAHPRRIFAIYTVLKNRGSDAVEYLNKTTGYDRWFLFMMCELLRLEEKVISKTLDKELLEEAKKAGISDKRIAKLTKKPVEEIEKLRKSLNIVPSYHFVDTCAGEFTAQTPFFYSTYGEINEGGQLSDNSVMILASGPNRIGQGLEFDTCCTMSTLSYKSMGRKTIIVNSNPETVSTDFKISDRLYMEPLTPEYVKSIMDKEGVKDIVVQLGGQTPLNMAKELEEYGANILGTSVQSIFDTEDRGLFASLVQRLGLRQPKNRMAGTFDLVRTYAREIGYPVLLRPSFVLGGRSMFIAYSDEQLEEFIGKGIEISQEKPVLVDQFLEDAFEYDLDAISDGQNVYIGGVMQHIEAAGIHSGDSACVFPSYKSNPQIEQEMVEAAVKFARELKVKGFLNIQFAVKDNILYLIEVNPRASRTVPFLSKASSINMVHAAVNIWQGIDLKQQGLVDDSGVGVGKCTCGWAVKEAVFSFDRFDMIDPVLGPEMKSTGEAIGTGDTFGEAFSKAQAAVGATLPTSGTVFISVNDKDKNSILPIAKKLKELGFAIAATRGTANFLYKNEILAEVIQKLRQGHPHAVDYLASGKISLLINTPMGSQSEQDDAYIRTEAVKLKVPYTTTISAAEAAVQGIEHLVKNEIIVRPLPPMDVEIQL